MSTTSHRGHNVFNPFIAACQHVPDRSLTAYLETELLKTARARGCPTVDGGNMVVFQAAEVFRLFTGIQPDSVRMLQWFRSNIRTSVRQDYQTMRPDRYDSTDCDPLNR